MPVTGELILLGNMLGRKKTIFIGSCIMVVGAAIQAASFSLGQLIASRLITGFGNGNASFPPGLSRANDMKRHEHLDGANLAS